MSKLNDLITQLCPDGVPYRKLLDVADVLYGAPFNAKQFNNDSEGMPLIRIRDIMRGYTETFYTGEYDDKYIIHEGDILIGMDGDFNIGKWKSDDALLNQRTLKIKHGKTNEVIDGYLYHLLGPILKGVNNRIQASTVKHLTAQWLKRIEIPVPPLPVQEEIVRILDSFTELEAELEAELAGRIEQYEYYRDHMLDKKSLERMDGKPVEMKKLGEVCNYVKNKVDIADILPENYTSVENLIKNCGGRMNAISVPKDGKCTDVMIGDILLGNIRPNLRKAWLATCAGGASNDVLVIRIKDGVNLNARYLYQIIAGNDFSCYNISHMRGAKMPRGDKSKILNYELPVPSLATQERIVDILDRFDTLTTSPTDGIPAEIAMRREQYEYCRSRILDFPRLPDDAASNGE